MQVKTLIKSNANIIRVSEVGTGDVYKRLDKPAYGDERVVYGVVLDVLANGEDAALVTLEFGPVSYGTDPKPIIKTFKGDGDVALFPAALDEYLITLDEVRAAQQKVVEGHQRTLDTAKSVMARMDDVRKAAQEGQLAAATTTVAIGA